ncbi:MAG: hypothetical protein QXZ31_07000 [Thermofilaceae archaeon]
MSVGAALKLARIRLAFKAARERLKPHARILCFAATAAAAAAAAGLTLVELHPIFQPGAAAVLAMLAVIGYLHGTDRTVAALAVALMFTGVMVVTGTYLSTSTYAFYGREAVVKGYRVPALYTLAALLSYATGYLAGLWKPLPIEQVKLDALGEWIEKRVEKRGRDGWRIRWGEGYWRKKRGKSLL